MTGTTVPQLDTLASAIGAMLYCTDADGATDKKIIVGEAGGLASLDPLTGRIPADQQDNNTFKNVKTHFGAVGDGVFDDTLALQAALDSNSAVWLPNGVYRITSDLIIDPIRNRNCGFIGMTGLSWYSYTDQAGGPEWSNGTNEALIIYDGDADPEACVIRISAEAVGVEPASLFTNNIYGVVLRGFTIDGNSKAGFGVYGVRMMEPDVESVFVRGTTRHGWYVNGSYSGKFTRIAAHRNLGCGISFGRAELDYGWAINSRVNGTHFDDLYATANGGDKDYEDGLATVRTAWAAETAYAVDSYFSYLGNTYKTETGFTSSLYFMLAEWPDWIASHAYVAGNGFVNAGIYYKVHTGYSSGGTFGATDTTNADVVVPTHSPKFAKSVSQWGYGVGMWLHRGNVVTSYTSELNDGPAFVFGPTSTSNIVGGGYSELSSEYSVSGTTAIADGRAERGWGLWFTGQIGASSLHAKFSNVFMAAEGIRLTGVAPSTARRESAFELNNISGADYINADWASYRLVNCALELESITGTEPTGAATFKGGIQFGTGKDVFNDYDPIAFVPALAGATVAGTGWAYTIQSAEATKVGRHVLFTGRIVLSAKSGDATGGIFITGLPFPVKNGNGAYSAVPLGNVLNMTTSMVSVSGVAIINTSTIRLQGRTGAQVSEVALTLADLSNTTAISFSGHYVTE